MVHLGSYGGNLLAEPALRCRLLGEVVECVGKNETCKVCVGIAIRQLDEKLTYQGLLWTML